MPATPQDSTSASSEGPCSSPGDGPTSTDTPGCQHEWMALQISYGVILGVDSTGVPVFIESSDDSRNGIGYGCGLCNEPWTPACVAS